MKTADEFLKDANEKYGDYFLYDMSTFNGMTNVINIICPIHGKYKQTPKNHLLSKFGCQLCANEKKKKKQVTTANSRIGQKATTKSGYEVECVEYYRSDNIIVRFNDGIKVKTAWCYFQTGAIDHPKDRNVRKADISMYLGLKSISTLGEEMTIIDARKASDIDVLFPNGSIAKNKRLDAFKKGEISNPSHTEEDIFLLHKKQRLGQQKQQLNGSIAKIVKYEKTHIVVEFENGKCKRSTYAQFIKGKIPMPVVRNKYDASRIGEKRILDDGAEIEIVEYKSSQHMTILVNGKYKKETNYRWFKEAKYIDAKSQQTHMPTVVKKKYLQKRIGEISYNVYTGEKMKLIEYNNACNVIVEFNDKTQVQSRYQEFKKGKIMNPNRPNRNQVSLNEFAILYHLSKYGFIHAKKGSLKEIGLGMLEIDVYHPLYKIGIEYDGHMHKKNKDIEKNIRCTNNGITLYRIQETKAPKLNIDNCYRLKDNKALSNNFYETLNNVIKEFNEKHSFSITPITHFNNETLKDEFYNYSYSVNDIVGMTRTLENDDILTIVRYGGCNDIDILLSNGEILKHKTLQAFKEYSWKNENDYNKAYYKGKQKVINGRICTIVEYISSNKIKVMFDDGYQKDIRKLQWEHGKISHPNDNLSISRIGEINTSDIGLTMKITEYINCRNITVVFNDGRYAHNVTYQAFKNGKVTPDGTNIITEKLRLQRIGNVYKNNNGKLYTIIDYISSNKALVQDELGNKKYCSYYDLQKGRIA